MKESSSRSVILRLRRLLFFNIILRQKLELKGKNMSNIKLIAKNPNAYHNYEILEKIECGIVLTGTEIKSIRQGKVNLKDSFAQIKNGECFAIGIHISPYEFGNIYNKDPLRDRKLLLNKSEINKLIRKSSAERLFSCSNLFIF